MTEAQKPAPPVVPHLVVKGAAQAIEFYKQAFGAVEVMRVPEDDGDRLMHACITINGGDIYLMDAFPEFNEGKDNSPEGFGGSPVVIHLNVSDVDAVWQQALDAGAKVEMPLEDQFWGDRYGQLGDPYGHSWSVSTPVNT